MPASVASPTLLDTQDAPLTVSGGQLDASRSNARRSSSSSSTDLAQKKRKRRLSVSAAPCSTSDTRQFSGCDTASDATADSSTTTVATESPEMNHEAFRLESTKRLKKLAVTFRDRISQVSEIKDPEMLYTVLCRFLADPQPRSLEALVKFYTVQRCTSRKVIRSTVKRLTPAQARSALLHFLDVSLLAGVALVPVESQFRQTWIMELIRQHATDTLEPVFRKKLQLSARQGNRLTTAQQSMAKLYARLTTALDHQYRLKLRKGEQINNALSPDSFRSVSRSKTGGAYSTQVCDEGADSDNQRSTDGSGTSDEAYSE